MRGTCDVSTDLYSGTDFGILRVPGTKEENRELGLSGTDKERVKVLGPESDTTESVGVTEPGVPSPSDRGRDLRRGCDPDRYCI